MSKDTSLLESVSKYFTEKTLQTIVANAHNEDVENIEILSWDFGNASKKGDSYLSTVDRIVIQSKVKGDIKELKIVVKSMPNNMARRKTFRSADFFRNEIMFYNEIAKTYEKFLKSKQQSSLLLLPECLASHLDGENDFIVLDDVCPRGFGPVTRQNCLTFEQCKCILEAMARFHGVSFAYKDQHKEDFERITSKLQETYLSMELYETWYKRFFNKLVNISKDALAKEYPNSDGEKKFNSYTVKDLYYSAAKFCSRTNNPSSVVNQGDSWAPNFLTRINSSNQIEVLILDFQLARCCSPVLDISFLMYSCTEKTLRDTHFDDLLNIYYDELSKTINILGSDSEKMYSRQSFLQEVQEQFVHGMVFALESVTFSTLSEEEIFDLDVIKEDKVDIADVWMVNNKETSESRQRLADVVMHAANRGFL